MAWHDATCATLDLEWEDGQPGCRKCERRAPRLAPVHPISPPAPPPDTPRSKLVCTWPPGLLSQPQSGDAEDSELLARLLANIDEWAGTTSVRSLQTALQSDQQSPLQQPPSQSGPDPLFRGIYSRLPNADSIRLLRLHGSADTSDPICGTLEIHRLRDPCRPIFEDFSYTWADSKGDSSLCKTIFLGPQHDVLPVTTNCLAVLRRFRTAVDRFVWVDAVCINQFDLRERGHQVSLMRDIYTSAARVLVYLGDSNHGAENAMALPQKIEHLPGEVSPSSDADFGAILRTPYFSRIWVIQEVMLSKTASVTFGNHTMHLEDLLSKFNTSIPTERTELAGNWLKHVGQKQGAQGLFSLLLATQNCHCGDLRDRVYGLMGLVTEEERDQLPVDNNISVQQLYAGLAAYWLTSAKGQARPAPWQIIQLALLPKITPFLPSWAPDWAPQSPQNASQGYTPMPLTFQIGTSCVALPSSGCDWLNKTGNNGRQQFQRGWTLHYDFWNRTPATNHGPRNDGSLYDFYQQSIAHKQLKPDIRRPGYSVGHLPSTGVLTLDAIHILSASIDDVELRDSKGTLVQGLQLVEPEKSDLKDRGQRGHDIHLYMIPRWGESLVLRKQSDAIYSIDGSFRIVFGSLERLGHSSPDSMKIIDQRLEISAKDIVEHWLMDLLFFGTCAGSAFANSSRGSRIQKNWWEEYPQACRDCQTSSGPFRTRFNDKHRSSTIAVMREIRGDVMDYVAENKVFNQASLGDQHPSDDAWPRIGVIVGDSARISTSIQRVHAYKRPVASSQEEMLAYLRNVVKRYRDSCTNYADTHRALSDLDDDDSKSALIWAYFENRENGFVFPVLKEEHHIELVLSDRNFEHPFNYSYIISSAWALLEDLAIDPRFTLEQNLNMLWIHVSTMEMVVRLRGILQQRLILKAIKDKMKNYQRIYLV